MTESQASLAHIIQRFALKDGLNESPVPGVYCIKVSQPKPQTKVHMNASIGIVAQGYKEIFWGRETYRHAEGNYIVTPIDLPVTSCVTSATPGQPFLCLKIDLNLRLLSEIAAQIEPEPPQEAENPARALLLGKASDDMMDAANRLGKLFATPKDAAVLGPLALREIFYHLLKGPDGPALRQFVLSGSKMYPISQAILRLRSRLDEEVDVAELAKAACMSRAAFFKRFKEVTAMSPIQYQKRLRLLEARRLMTEAGESAEGSAFQVGYRSASQFSREYARMFGNPPRRDATKIRETGQPIPQL